MSERAKAIEQAAEAVLKRWDVIGLTQPRASETIAVSQTRSAMWDRIKSLRAALNMPEHSEVPDIEALRVWAKDSNRKPPELAFTAGPTRQMADWLLMLMADDDQATGPGYDASKLTEGVADELLKENERLRKRLRAQTRATQEAHQRISDDILASCQHKGIDVTCGGNLDPKGHPIAQVVGTITSALQCENERLKAELADRNICEYCDRPLFPEHPACLPACPECVRELKSELAELKKQIASYAAERLAKKPETLDGIAASLDEEAEDWQ